MSHQGYGGRKFFRLEGHSREIAERIESIAEGGAKMTSEELKDAQNNLGLFTGALMAFPAQGGPEYYAICPALHRSQHEPEHYYLLVPVSDMDHSHVTPHNAVEITDEEHLKRLDSLFAEGADMIFMHQHSQGPYIAPAGESAADYDGGSEPGM
ncbi:MAG: hypothetical protein KDI90_09865 [Alphaproteobacteria bacterium]|nr:hypothetical protein [Alphaproteobacteria bacterium]